jgi:hypothetical protein
VPSISALYPYTLLISGREWPGKGKFILDFQKKFKTNQAQSWEGEGFLGTLADTYYHISLHGLKETHEEA